MNQDLINHIRATTPKGNRNRYRRAPYRRTVLSQFLILSAASLGIIGVCTIVIVITTK